MATLRHSTHGSAGVGSTGISTTGIGTKKGQATAQTKKASSHRRPPMHHRVEHSELDDVEHEEVFEIFKAYDRDDSGSINRAEFAHLLEALGQNPDEDELAVALDVVDANHSGKISWEEFKAWWSNP